MPVPRDLAQQLPPPWAEAWMQKPQSGGKFLVQIPGGARGMVMDEIDTCIICAIFISVNAIQKFLSHEIILVIHGYDQCMSKVDLHLPGLQK